MYESGLFHLVVKKGTLDAMLSEKTGRMRDCIKIVLEMGRVCKVDGYLVIVSHLNLHLQGGIECFKQVVIAGLWLLDGGGDGTRAATKNKVGIYLFYFNLYIMLNIGGRRMQVRGDNRQVALEEIRDDATIVSVFTKKRIQI